MKNTIVVVFLFTTITLFCSQEEEGMKRLKNSQQNELGKTVQNETMYNNSQRESSSRRPDPNIERVKSQASQREPRENMHQ